MKSSSQILISISSFLLSISSLLSIFSNSWNGFKKMGLGLKKLMKPDGILTLDHLSRISDKYCYTTPLPNIILLVFYCCKQYLNWLLLPSIHPSTHPSIHPSRTRLFAAHHLFYLTLVFKHNCSKFSTSKFTILL